MSDNEYIEKAKQSLCVIEGQDKIQKYQYGISNGIFLTKNTVLTALHCLEDLTNLTFKNSNGAVTVADKAYKAKTKSNLDICLIKVKDPIGVPYGKIVRENSYNPAIHRKGFLVSKFNDGVYQSVPVEYDAFNQNLYEMDKELGDKCVNHIFFSSQNLQIGPGYSGAPIIAQDGRIISICSDTMIAPHLVQIFLNSVGKYVEHPFPFRVPDPQHVAKFIDNAI